MRGPTDAREKRGELLVGKVEQRDPGTGRLRSDSDLEDAAQPLRSAQAGTQRLGLRDPQRSQIGSLSAPSPGHRGYTELDIEPSPQLGLLTQFQDGALPGRFGRLFRLAHADRMRAKAVPSRSTWQRSAYAAADRHIGTSYGLCMVSVTQVEARRRSSRKNSLHGLLTQAPVAEFC